jgi:type VI secretion system protein ImpF
MNRFSAGLMDRLFGDGPTQLTLEQHKDSIARDLEALLNTRLAILPEDLAPYPHCRNSILNYGLVDFADKCMSSPADRAAVCASLKQAIERHEPRLSNVYAALEKESGTVNRLHFVISATLRMPSGREPVNFNAVLQPSSLRYSISRAARSSRNN